MKDWLLSGRLIDVALAVIALELVVLLALAVRRRNGLRPLDVLGQLLAGLLLMLAVRCALTGADYRWTIVLVSASFPAHVFDLARRSRAA